MGYRVCEITEREEAWVRESGNRTEGGYRQRK